MTAKEEMDLWLKGMWGSDIPPDRRFEYSPIYATEGVKIVWPIHGRRKVDAQWWQLYP